MTVYSGHVVEYHAEDETDVEVTWFSLRESWKGTGATHIFTRAFIFPTQEIADIFSLNDIVEGLSSEIIPIEIPTENEADDDE